MPPLNEPKYLGRYLFGDTGNHQQRHAETPDWFVIQGKQQHHIEIQNAKSR